MPSPQCRPKLEVPTVTLADHYRKGSKYLVERDPISPVRIQVSRQMPDTLIVATRLKSLDTFSDERIGHPRRGGKPEFKEGRCPPLDEPACCASCLWCWLLTARKTIRCRAGSLKSWGGERPLQGHRGRRKEQEKTGLRIWICRGNHRCRSRRTE